MITSLAEELTHAREALAAIAAAQSPLPPAFLLVYTPPVPPSLAPETPSSSFGPPGFSSGSRRETSVEWASLLATPAAPMLRHRASSTSEGEPSRQRHRVSFVPEDVVHIISSDSEVESDDEESSVCQCPCHPRY
jgi:hypothetical protein